MAYGVNGDLNNQTVNIRHNGNSIVCNLFQAYLLNTSDNYDIASAIVNHFNQLRVKLNGVIVVNGNQYKFKKYLGDNKSALSPLTLQLSEENKMFSLF